MTQSFSIMKSFIRKVELDATGLTQLDIKSASKLKSLLSVKVGRSHLGCNKYHLVDIQVVINSYVGKKTVLDLNMNYAAVVEITKAKVGKVELNRILNVDVPHALYDNIASVVYYMTQDSCHPYCLNADDFASSIRYTTEDSPENIVAPPIEDKIVGIKAKSKKIDFHEIIEDLKATRSGKTFMKTYVEYVGDDVFTTYESLPIYKCYYRFFTPIEYKHPDFDECDEAIWPMLFQMLYGSFRAKCRLVDEGNCLPEIVFSLDNGYDEYVDMPISALSLDALKDLFSDLFVEALTDISMDLIDYKERRVAAGEPLPYNRTLTKKEFFELYGTSVHDMYADFLNTMYNRIKDCDIQTVLYRS